jgi:hypothetical protein
MKRYVQFYLGLFKPKNDKMKSKRTGGIEREVARSTKHFSKSIC